MKRKIYFYIDESGHPGLKRGLKWRIVAIIYTYEKNIIHDTYGIVKEKLKKISPTWENRELKGVNMKNKERKIVLETLKNSDSKLNFFVIRFDTYEAPDQIVKNKGVKFSDTDIALDPVGLDARQFAFGTWEIIKQEEDNLSEVILFYDGESFRKLKEELKIHLERQLNGIPFKMNFPDSKDCEGVQLADILANSYYRSLNGGDSIFQIIKDRVVIRECKIGLSNGNVSFYMRSIPP
jgi:hypothetical protein